MRKHDFSYFFGEGMRNMFSHGFMSFAAVGITVACLVVMGTFSLVAYNAQVQLQQLESEYEILAFVDESCDDAQTKAVGRAIEQRANVKECVFISKEEAMKSFEARYEGDNMFQNLDPEILRDRYAVYVDDLSISGKTAQDIFDNVEGVANVRVDEDIAGGFITLRNVASVVCIALIAILLLVSVFIISNTIKLTTAFSARCWALACSGSCMNRSQRALRCPTGCSFSRSSTLRRSGGPWLRSLPPPVS